MQPYHYSIRLPSSARVRVITQYSISQLSDMFHSRGYTCFTPIVKNDTTDSLCINFTLNRQLFLLRKLPDIHCAWLLQVQARKTYDLLGQVSSINIRLVSVLQEDEIYDESLCVFPQFNVSYTSSPEITWNCIRVEIIY